MKLHAPPTTRATIVIAGCTPRLEELLTRIADDLGHRTVSWNSDRQVPEAILQEHPHVCICGSATSKSQSQLLWDLHSDDAVLLWIQDEISALDPPFPAEVVPDDLAPREWTLLVRLAAERALNSESRQHLERQIRHATFRHLVCHSPAMKQLQSQLFRTAPADQPLVLAGEPGIDVREIAWTVHQLSPRRENPFDSVDCSLLSADSFERELFGDQLGAEADPAPGLLEQLDGGTLLLTRAEGLARTTQKKLIRFLESPAVIRGDSRSLRYVNVRILFAYSDTRTPAAERALWDYLQERRDVGSLALPPLRERREDLRALAQDILVRHSAQLGVVPPRLTPDALERLAAYPWPGNDEELRKVLVQILQGQTGPLVSAEMIEPWLADQPADDTRSVPGMSLAEMERQLIEATFARCGGNRETTAQSLGIGLRTLSGKLRQYGYPPRGGPGSNRTHRETESAPADHTARRAA